MFSMRFVWRLFVFGMRSDRVPDAFCSISVNVLDALSLTSVCVLYAFWSCAICILIMFEIRFVRNSPMFSLRSVRRLSMFWCVLLDYCLEFWSWLWQVFLVLGLIRQKNGIVCLVFGIVIATTSSDKSWKSIGNMKKKIVENSSFNYKEAHSRVKQPSRVVIVWNRSLNDRMRKTKEPSVSWSWKQPRRHVCSSFYSSAHISVSFIFKERTRRKKLLNVA